MAASSVLSAVVAAVVDSLIGKVIGPLLEAAGRTRPARPVPGWEALIERHCGDVRIIGRVFEEPRIEFLPRLVLTDAEEAERERIIPTIPRNDPHALLVDPPNLAHTPFKIRVHPLDYADLEVLRQRDQHQGIVSAGALLVCPRDRILILHHRSKESRTYPDALHIVGGAYIPPGVRSDIEHDGDSLFSTVQREVMEETRAAIAFDNDPPIVVAEEISTRFFQFVVHGAEISSKQASMLRENWEGEGLIKLPFDEVERWLLRPPLPWVPTGKAHLLAWLAQGAPGAGTRPRFGRYAPKRLFEHIVSL